MSLGPVKPALHGASTQLSGAHKGRVVKGEDKKKNHGDNDDNCYADSSPENSSEDVHKILKKAVEAELPKVNILDETGKKRVPDVSGMVINILT